MMLCALFSLNFLKLIKLITLAFTVGFINYCGLRILVMAAFKLLIHCQRIKIGKSCALSYSDVSPIQNQVVASMCIILSYISYNCSYCIANIINVLIWALFSKWFAKLRK